jgi:hypothetical protein
MPKIGVEPERDGCVCVARHTAMANSPSANALPTAVDDAVPAAAGSVKPARSARPRSCGKRAASIVTVHDARHETGGNHLLLG